MKKLASALLLLFMGAVCAQAQITTGQPTSNVIRTGNRADKGDFGLYLGATSTIFEGLFKKDVDFKGLPLINLKYMVTDKVETRLGFEWWAKNTSKTNYDDDHEWLSKEINQENTVMFYPGVAYHFNRSNILDVYVGGELPIGGAGLASYPKINDDDAEENEHDHYRATQFTLGLGAFIGLQAYICNLPLAIGLEYGVSCLYNHVGNGTLTKDGMSIEANMPHVKDNSFKLGNQARLTISYFFKN